ncbi:MAG: aspartyl protease [Desulfitibacter sp. BRH_c19]|nr:MAG: aspartyl protease [Desulfitibacter sp. BRH_c19]
MKLRLHDGLLYSSIEITHCGVVKVIENIVIDTGAVETLISPDIVEDLGIVAELKDEIKSFYGVGGSLHYFFSKRIDQVNFGNVNLRDFKLDFGVIDPKGEINGLLGLDLLMEARAIINLKELTLKFDVS